MEVTYLYCILSLYLTTHLPIRSKLTKPSPNHCLLSSNVERILYNDTELNIATNLSVNGRIFVSPIDHIDALTPLPEQDFYQDQLTSGLNVGQSTGSGGANGLAFAAVAGLQAGNTNSSNSASGYLDVRQMHLSTNRLEEFSSQDIAYCLTNLGWALLQNLHEYELIYTVFGRHNFKQITANLNVFLRHFNELQYWVVTEICLSTSLSKRVQILRKFIKIAAQ